jgi:uncharacterized protein (DUF2252 family)
MNAAAQTKRASRPAQATPLAKGHRPAETAERPTQGSSSEGDADPPMSRDDRAAQGKVMREKVPLAAHAEVAVVPGDDPVGLLEEQSRNRISELIPVRYGRMLVSPFTFYRGAAVIMAKDLAQTPHTDLNVQLCGDAHVSNFGLFASPERRLVFDINDFDETHPGPFEWDVKRFAASLEIAGRDNGFTVKQRRKVVLSAVGVYRDAIRQFAKQSNLAVWYSHQAVQPGLPGLGAIRSKATQKMLRKNFEKALTRDNLGSLNKLAESVQGRLRIVSEPPLVVPARELPLEAEVAADLDGWMSRLLAEYAASLQSDRRHLIEQYAFVDIARKVVGVGSVGTRAWMVLLTGIDNQDPLFLQAKEATTSVIEEHTSPSLFNSHGQRVVDGQRLMQAYGDILLGWHYDVDSQRPDYYVRQLRDWKGSIELASLDPAALSIYAGYCAWTLARAHCRSGDRIAIASYLGGKDGFDQALADFSAAYADKNERDFGLLAAAEASSRLAVERGL